MMKPEDVDLIIIGGGLAGCEAAWAAASKGIQVAVYEMRPEKMTGAHVTGQLAELVCSNSLGSNLIDRASGLLKEELRHYGSLLVSIAEETALPAGNALAVDRKMFSEAIERKISSHPNIRVIREEVTELPADVPVIVASGPLTSVELSRSIIKSTGENNLFFYDAIAPVVALDSIDFEIAFRASRYDRENSGKGDYINCPFLKDEYYAFIDSLLSAERIQLKDFERNALAEDQEKPNRFFEGCLPVEVLAARGKDSLAFGPLRPVGLRDPRTGHRPWAVLQLRQDNLAGDLYNLVGFQTNLKYSEQQRVFQQIPGLEHAVFERFGQMHRNSFISAPGLINEHLQLIQDQRIFFAGQIAGVEGYMGNIGTGLVAGLNAAAWIKGEPLLTIPSETMLGSMLFYISHAEKETFQPVKANFGILPPLENPARSKKERANQYASRSLLALGIDTAPEEPVDV